MASFLLVLSQSSKAQAPSPHTRAHRRESARTHTNTLISHRLGKKTSETLSISIPSLCHAPGRLQASSAQPETRTHRGSGPLLPGHSGIRLAPTVCPALPSRSWGAGWGRRHSAQKGSQTREGEGGLRPKPCCGLFLLLQLRSPGRKTYWDRGSWACRMQAL